MSVSDDSVSQSVSQPITGSADDNDPLILAFGDFLALTPTAATLSAVDLVRSLLEWDYHKRMSIAQAACHKFLVTDWSHATTDLEDEGNTGTQETEDKCNLGLSASKGMHSDRKHGRKGMNPFQFHALKPVPLPMGSTGRAGTTGVSGGGDANADWTRRQFSHIWAPLPQAFEENNDEFDALCYEESGASCKSTKNDKGFSSNAIGFSPSFRGPSALGVRTNGTDSIRQADTVSFSSTPSSNSNSNSNSNSSSSDSNHDSILERGSKLNATSLRYAKMKISELTETDSEKGRPFVVL